MEDKKYSDLTYEKLKTIISDVLFKDFKPSEKIEDIGQCGDSGLYYIGSGCYTNKSGWEEFNKILLEESKNNSNFAE